MNLTTADFKPENFASFILNINSSTKYLEMV